MCNLENIQNPGGCFCDEQCFELGDCCPDICDVCPDMAGCVPCEADCTGAVCGDDGCGGSCGDCEGDLVCSDGQCVEPSDDDCKGPTEPSGDDCMGLDLVGCCSADGRAYWCDGDELFCSDCTQMEGECGWLADQAYYDCGTEGGEDPDGAYPKLCANTPCNPACDGKVCGSDGCGGDCGTCLATEVCNAGVCEGTGGCAGVCTPGDKGCEGDTSAWVCDHTVAGCKVVTECADGEACADGECSIEIGVVDAGSEGDVISEDDTGGGGGGGGCTTGASSAGTFALFLLFLALVAVPLAVRKEQ